MKGNHGTQTPRILNVIMFSTVLLLSNLVFSGLSLAGDSWTNAIVKGEPIAVTPKYRLHIYMAKHPTEPVWGKLDIPIKAEQLPELNNHLKSPNFPFIDVAIEVDKYYRVMQGRIYKDELIVSVDLDLRQWDGLKKGDELEIVLPGGTEFKESLRGSGTALRKIERR
ncbi:hypothetical protein FT643_00790 [Ketobacter sp. MCCC 1A13808]|uniref:hypothetical protein n=1 Tax=Ketobacter sp. MCCC 1A13808 TaxID=2602738 RepID=UPI000F25CBE3|nr:hypothetical protein [Ketobacter sp. MCCC 1A13808]MVF10665.1 hypothetical protein [Ketobacter sp. MCCC 1A13808]RLP56085.1 MAG: hypothetical protein D6160_01415 [Ketobacter sp.]